MSPPLDGAGYQHAAFPRTQADDRYEQAQRDRLERQREWIASVTEHAHATIESERRRGYSESEIACGLRTLSTRATERAMSEDDVGRIRMLSDQAAEYGRIAAELGA